MGQFRVRSLALVAAAALAGCPATGPNGVVSPPAGTDASPAPGGASASPVGTPSPDGTATATPSPAPTATGTASVAPSPSPSATAPAAVATGIVKGKVVDAEFKVVPDGTVVEAESLDASQPYKASTTTADGNYVFNAIPLNVQIRLAATRPGWTRRTRVIVARRYDERLGDRNVFNFGGFSTTIDASGPSYFLSQHPEIESVEPTDQDSSLPLERMSFKLTLSEPLDAANRRRLGAAFQIVPNNVAALEEGGALPADDTSSTELTGLHVGKPPVAPATDAFPNPPYVYRQNSAFLGGLQVSKFEWDAAGKVATFALEAPVKTDDADEAEYAFMLVLRDKDKIVDADGRALGTGSDDEFGSYASLANKVIYNAVREPAVNLNEDFTNEKTRWADTHITYSRFRVRNDVVRPKLEKVLARRNFTDVAGTDTDRIEMTFSEPMMAYPRITSLGTRSLNNYVIATAAEEADLSARKLAADGSADVAGPSTLATEIREKFATKNAVVVGTNTASGVGYKVEVSPIDPKVVILSLPGGAFPLDANYVKVFVGGDTAGAGGVGDFVADPAGNRVDTSAESQLGPIL